MRPLNPRAIPHALSIPAPPRPTRDLLSLCPCACTLWRWLLCPLPPGVALRPLCPHVVHNASPLMLSRLMVTLPTPFFFFLYLSRLAAMVFGPNPIPVPAVPTRGTLFLCPLCAGVAPICNLELRMGEIIWADANRHLGVEACKDHFCLGGY